MMRRFTMMVLFLIVAGFAGWVSAGIEVKLSTPEVNPDGTSEEIGGVRLIFTAPEFVQTPADGDTAFLVTMRISPTYNKRIVSVGGQTNWQSFTPIPLVWETESGYFPVNVYTEVNSARIWSFYPGDAGTGANSYIDILFLDDQKTWPINETSRARITIGAPAFYTNNPEDPYQSDTRIRVDFSTPPDEFFTGPFWYMGVDCSYAYPYNPLYPYRVYLKPSVWLLARKD